MKRMDGLREGDPMSKLSARECDEIYLLVAPSGGESRFTGSPEEI